MIGEKREVNLENPIFVFYFDVSGMSHLHAEEYARSIVDNFNYSNITMWFVAVQDGHTRIECVYDGMYNKGTIRKILDAINEFPDVEYYAEIKNKIRDILIGELV